MILKNYDNCKYNPKFLKDFKDKRRQIKNPTCKNIETGVRPAEVAAAKVMPNKKFLIFIKVSFLINNKN